MNEQPSGSKNSGYINTRSFLVALVIIFALMTVSYVLTLVIPGGEYARVEDAEGNLVLDAGGTFTPVEGGIPFWKWLLSPFLVLGASGSGTILAIIAFLLVIGGVFGSLEKFGLMKYMLAKITARYGKNRYKLQAILILFFMAMGSLVGSFEECVPLIPIVVSLSICLGWDGITGIAMCLLPCGCGFAAGVFNPFTVGMAQQLATKLGLADLPMFSGSWLRIVSFILIYGLLLLTVRRHAKKVERPLSDDTMTFVEDKRMDAGILTFALILGLGIALVFSSVFIEALRDYTMIIVAVVFLVSGLCSLIVAGMGGKELGKTFLSGSISMLPAVLMILMASSIKYTMETAHILDTILHAFAGVADKIPGVAVILLIYLLVLLMNFFIASGSAKVFILIPLILPIASLCGVSPQLCILAFAFGDGFSNVFYPTNPVLLIGLGVADVSYGKWVRWSWLFQLLNLLLTSGILLFGYFIQY